MSKKELEDKTSRVFCDKEIMALIEDASLYSNKNLSNQVNPASIDTTMSDIGWEVPAALSFRNNESMETLDNYFNRFAPNQEGYFILEPKKHYIFLLNERIDLDLHPEVSIKANPKSSTGRVDLYVRLVSDAKNSFNSLEEGYRGKIGLLMESKTFRVGIKPGASLNQLRFQKGSPLIKKKELHKRYLQDELLLDKNGEVIEKYKVNFGEGLLLSLNLTTPIYKAKKGVQEIVYLDRDREKNQTNAHDPKKFFEKIIIPENEVYFLKKGEFILGCTDEIIRFPEDTCGELEGYNDEIGPDARVHYAGFVDPKWCSRLTYEIRANEDLRLEHKKPLARIFYYKLKHQPEKGYGDQEGRSSHYGKEILTTYTELPKFFKKWKVQEVKKNTQNCEEQITKQKEVLK